MKLEQVRCFFQMLTQLEDVQPKEQTACTYAGTTPQQADHSQQVTAARKLREQYQQMCSPMLLDRQFYFQRTHLNREEQSEEDAANSKPSTEPATGTADAGLSGI